jgi:hypothetical protein
VVSDINHSTVGNTGISCCIPHHRVLKYETGLMQF